MKKEHFKTIAIASLLICILSLISLLVSLNSTNKITQNIVYIFVLSTSLIVFLVSLALYFINKNKKNSKDE